MIIGTSSLVIDESQARMFIKIGALYHKIIF